MRYYQKYKMVKNRIRKSSSYYWMLCEFCKNKFIYTYVFPETGKFDKIWVKVLLQGLDEKPSIQQLEAKSPH